MLAYLVYLYLKLLFLTCRIRVLTYSQDVKLLFEEKRPAIYTTWNDRYLFLVQYLSLKGFWLLATPTGRSDSFIRVIDLITSRSAKGSPDGGGRHALLSLLEKLKQGIPVTLSADSSRGTPFECKAAPFILSQESQHPIIPTSWNCARKVNVTLNGNNYILPLPFTKIEIVLNAPIKINRHHKFHELDDVKETLKTQLNKS